MREQFSFDTVTVNIDGNEGFAIGFRDKFLVYFPLRQTIFEVSETAFQILNKCPKGTNERMKLETKIAFEISHSPILSIEGIPSIDKENNVLGLALTTACNLQCSYCHADAGNNKHMGKSVIDGAIEKTFTWCKDNSQGFYLIFTGSGEPTMNWEGLTYAVEKAKNLCSKEDVPLFISMATNGFYGDIKRTFILSNFSRVTLSLDGPADVHDSNRITTSKKKSFATVFTTAKFFYNNKVNFRLRSTVSAKYSHRMLEIYEFFQSEFPNTKGSFEPLNPIGRGIEIHDTPLDDEFAQGYLSILEKYGGQYVSYSAISSIYKLRKNFCSPVARPNVNISIDGKIHACSRANSGEGFVFGSYNENEKKFVYNADRITELTSLNVDSFPDCKFCFAKYHCAGDCHDLRSHGYFRCGTNKAILYHLIREQINSK